MEDFDEEFAPPSRDRSTTFTLAMTAGFFVVLFVLWLLLKDKAGPDGPENPQPGAGTSGTRVGERERVPVAVPVGEAEEDGAIVDPAPSIATVDGQPKADFEILPNCRLVTDAANDGDSVLCRTESGKVHRFTLYWADAPETGAPATTYAQKFEISDDAVTPVAADAADMVQRLIGAVPFHVYTAWKKGPGDSMMAYIYYEDGRGERQNLSQTMIRQGLAIIEPCEAIFPETGQLPSGGTPGQILEILQKVQAEAREKKRGAWGIAR